jgi:hypothetical protein
MHIHTLVVECFGWSTTLTPTGLLFQGEATAGAGQASVKQGGGGGDEIIMTMVENLAGAVESRHSRVMESLQDVDQRLRGLDKKLARATLPGGAGAGAAAPPARAEVPVQEAPLPADAMDAIKQDLHFAIALAVRNVLDKHPGGVVLLNIPDHNKPAGMFECRTFVMTIVCPHALVHLFTYINASKTNH